MYCIANLYAPNEDKPDFFVEILENFDNITVDQIILAGDFNQVLNPDMDKKGGQKLQTSKSAHVINEYLERYDWLDVWRTVNPDRFTFTFKKCKPLVMTRLDYFLAPLGTIHLLADCQIIPAYLTDHCSVEMTIKHDMSIKGPGYWKLNVQHVQDKDFIDQVNELIDRAKNK